MVGREGVEPPKAKLADLQSAPFGHSGICPEIIYISYKKITRYKSKINSNIFNL